MPEEQGGGFLSQRPGGIPMGVWLAAAALVVYLIYRHYAGAGTATSGNTGDTGGTITTGNTTVDTGAVQISVTQNQPDQDQPQPPTHGKKTTHSTHHPRHHPRRPRPPITVPPMRHRPRRPKKRP